MWDRVDAGTIGFTLPSCGDTVGAANQNVLNGKCWDPTAAAPAVAAPPAAAPTAPAASGGATTPAPPTFDQVQTVVRRLLVQLDVPLPEIQVGPDPSANEWNMAVVGMPLWVWTTEPATKTASITQHGYTFTLDARRDALTFDFGDGTTLTCATTTPFPGPSAAGQASPTCGHVYKQPSLPRGNYTIVARAQWSVRWSALGYSGTIPMRLTNSRVLPVGELQSVRVR